MTRERLSFQRPVQAPPRGTSGLIAILLCSAAALVLIRPWLAPQAGEGLVVEVSGDVPRPGFYLVTDETVAGAVQAAGGPLLSLEAGSGRRLSVGERVIVRGEHAEIRETSDLVLVGLPLDLNGASVEEIDALPSISRQTAERIVSDRERRGPFRSIDALSRVAGVGAQTAALLAPFVQIGEISLIDINQAGEATLEQLPGIGPVLAQRIVSDRTERGPFPTIEALGRVSGVGPELISAITPLVSTGLP